ncbi:predicted protein [Aspergillus nidulans FGSC A4]|uniref:Uncharacterized protein n=1 Tax=Emericella nidulans (strain FGSC A4 / ATCC 38163 / CBS 112.46 / NRRL 194 / M139) TaxID=227321 RepID=Q5BGI8_EMENI|nr:hypothetical protein [Aspergillus nidulans FGSC A4]EAA65748.1 predicted protein [Aspergillus nidulans FGSC A4]CBF89685.1 TPA: conserved hypothetical protein [Aspergillus nidulans FGSC A4]|eukprot:XP_657946.1 predicted protein [Aspergillus nidulans FGSC A4]
MSFTTQTDATISPRCPRGDAASSFECLQNLLDDVPRAAASINQVDLAAVARRLQYTNANANARSVGNRSRASCNKHRFTGLECTIASPNISTEKRKAIGNETTNTMRKLALGLELWSMIWLRLLVPRGYRFGLAFASSWDLGV